MVHGIQRDREPKTQTRRVIKPQPAGEIEQTSHSNLRWLDTRYWERTHQKENRGLGTTGFTCPYGGPGDEMWVKETWKTCALYDDCSPSQIDSGAALLWLADGSKRLNGPEEFGRTRVSIHMPRWASRITLAVENVRAQRVSEISEQDALAEGIRAFTKDGKLFKYWWCDPSERGTPKASFTTWQDMPRTAVEAYRRLWNGINATPSPVMKRGRDGKKFLAHYVAYPWKLNDLSGIFEKHPDDPFWLGIYQDKSVRAYPNPHVWAITFRRK